MQVRNNWKEVMSCLNVSLCVTYSVTSVFMTLNPVSVAGFHVRVLTDVCLTDVPRDLKQCEMIATCVVGLLFVWLFIDCLAG